MLFETETVEQRFLHHHPLAHHRPLSRFTDKVNQRAVTAASRSFSTESATVRNLVMAWVLTLPASIVLSGILFWIFRHVF
jgi:PiT family inorganic phosphate transporter